MTGLYRHQLLLADPCGRWLDGIVGSNPTGSMNVCRECCVLSGRGLCDRPITRPKEFYRGGVCVCVCLSVIICNNDLYTYYE